MLNENPHLLVNEDPRLVVYLMEIHAAWYIYPLTPRRTLVAPFTEISIPFKEGIIKKISYERRAYESVDERSLS